MIAYLRASRQPLYGLVLGLPLWLLYEGLAAALGTSLRNGADVWLVNLFALAGVTSPWLLKGVALVALGALFLWRGGERRVRGSYLAGMIIEATVYSLLLGTVVVSLLGLLRGWLAFPAQQEGLLRLTLSLGAGVYEELLFRVLLFGGLWWLLRRVGWGGASGAVVAALVSALMFSAAHHLGPMGEPFDPYTFAYRGLSGLLFTGLYVARGFGITAYTHALYDVWVTLGVL